MGTVDKELASIRVEQLNFVQLPLQTKRPFRVAYGQTTDPVHVICQIKIEGTAGYGAAGPAKATRQTTETICAALQGARKHLVGQIFDNDMELRQWIGREKTEEDPSAAAALDMAVWDWHARKKNVPLYNLLIEENALRPKLREIITTDMTIGLESVEDTLQLVSDYSAAGFGRLKIKLGHPLPEQKELIARIRRQAGDKIQLLADSNQAYSTAESIELIRALRENHFIFLEQPVDAANLDALAEVARNSPIPIFADEAALNVADIKKIGREKTCQGIVLKVMKLGGITPTLHAIEAARHHGLQMMLGCNTETTLSIAAALHIAMANPDIEHIDLDGHLLLQNQPVQVIATEKNRLIASGVGLGPDRLLEPFFKSCR